MKKLLSVFLAVCLAVVCGIGFVACDSIDAPTNKPEIGDNNNNGGNTPDDDKTPDDSNGDKKPDDNNGDKKPVYSDIYYAYDAETDEYEDADFIAISSTAAAWHGVDISLGDLDFDGSVRFDGNDFTITLNGKFSAQDTCIMTYRGKKEGDGVLRVDSTVITKYSSLVPQPSVTTDITVRYYCKKGSKPIEQPPERPVAAKNYFLYNANDKTYDETEYVKLDGDKFTVHFEKGVERIKPLTLVGEVTELNGSNFKAECVMDIKDLSDYMTDRAESEFYSSLGYAPSGIEFFAKLKVECNGYVYDNAIRVQHLEVKIYGFTGMFSKLNMNKALHSSNIYDMTVYCQKGATPDYSVNVTFDMDGGTLDGRDKIVIRTDGNGKLTLPSGTPTKQDLGFLEYCYKTENGLGGKVKDGVTLYGDTAIAVHWMPYVTITYDINSDEYKFVNDGDRVIKVLAGTRIGRFPQLTAKVGSPKTRFKGWFYDNAEINPAVLVSDKNTNVTYTAQWHSEQTVKSFNSNLVGGYRYQAYQVNIHFIPQFYEEDHDGWYGGGSECYIRLEKDGKPDSEKRYSLSTVYYDISGYFYPMEIGIPRDYVAFNPTTGELLGSERVDFRNKKYYIEFKQSDGTFITFYVDPLVNLEQFNHDGYYHIFLHEFSDEVTAIW